MFQNVECQSDDLLPVGRINVGGRHLASLNGGDALVGQAVNAQETDGLLASQFLGGLVGTERSEVVLAEDDIYGLARQQPLFGNGIRLLGRPVALYLVVGYLWVPGHHAGEALIALMVGRHHQPACNLQHDGLAAGSPDAVAAEPDGIAPHGAACLKVVAADESSKVGRCGLALEEDDGYAALMGLVDAGGQRAVLVGRDDQQVDIRVEQGVNLLPLTAGAVVGVGDDDLHIGIVEVLGRQHLVVGLVAPHATDAL